MCVCMQVIGQMTKELQAGDAIKCTNEEAEQDIASSEKCTWQSDKGTGWKHDSCWYKQIYLHLLSITMFVCCNLHFLSKLPENITGDSCYRCFPRVKYCWIKLQYV